MRTKSLMLLMMTVVIAAGIILFGFIFVNGQVGHVQLTEETLAGTRSAAKGITAGFRADAGDDLHWITSYDFSSGLTNSTFKRGEMDSTSEWSVYDDFRFIGWSSVPYTTLIENPALEGLQERNIQQFYADLDDDSGKIRLADYLDFYPIGFRFQFGTKIFHADDALKGLKIYEDNGNNRNAAYDEDVQLYVDLNHFFRIPVIENEYQKYRVLDGRIELESSMDEGDDYYQFDPIIVLQEENLMDGIKWVHPDMIHNVDLQKDADYIGKTAEQYNLKNRILFIVNNRTVNENLVDVSKITDGYGIYELPIETKATASVRYGKRSATVPNPKPLSNQLSMVYPLDDTSEYVEMTISPDHRFLALFFIRDHDYFIKFVDADTWETRGEFKLFGVSEKMTYAWGDDCSLAATNFQNEIAVFTKEPDKEGYRSLYCGFVPEDFDESFFDDAMIDKPHGYAVHRCGIDYGLAVVEKNGKAAIVQNPLIGQGSSGIRDASLTCAVIDEKGIQYWGKLESNVKDYGIGEETLSQDIRIHPVRNENWIKWE